MISVGPVDDAEEDSPVCRSDLAMAVPELVAVVFPVTTGASEAFWLARRDY